MNLTGKNLIAGRDSGLGSTTFRGISPASGEAVGRVFYEATDVEIDLAVTAAADALDAYAALPQATIASFLEKIAEEILALDDTLIQCAVAETALHPDRITGERGRTIHQLRMFADIARQGTWKDVRIDLAMPDRKPLRRPDLRRTLIPVGPVAVWAASNFPLAFSVAGGDTAAALAAGCPVIVKAHPGHPGTSELAARAIAQAAAELGLPAGVFSLLQGTSPNVSLALVRHPKVAAGAFTGSLRAGRALFDAAAQRPEPIPFFAEMGSVNPVFLLPHALEERNAAIAEGLAQSVNMGVGQFCTCPGLAIGVDGPAFAGFAEQLRDRFSQAKPGNMLTASIAKLYGNETGNLESLAGIRTTKASTHMDSNSSGQPMLFETDATTFLNNLDLRHEVFGPSTILVRCASAEELEKIARSLEGSLTATIQGTEQDLRDNRALITLLARKAGRLLFNGYPTGVEVCSAMQHGGPYPATTDARFTSVGATAIQRFARPLCFQDFPQEFLPAELQS